LRRPDRMPARHACRAVPGVRQRAPCDRAGKGRQPRSRRCSGGTAPDPHRAPHGAGTSATSARRCTRHGLVSHAGLHPHRRVLPVRAHVPSKWRGLGGLRSRDRLGRRLLVEPATVSKGDAVEGRPFRAPGRPRFAPRGRPTGRRHVYAPQHEALTALLQTSVRQDAQDVSRARATTARLGRAGRLLSARSQACFLRPGGARSPSVVRGSAVKEVKPRPLLRSHCR
jgi:hypothetical protein